ncbi:restriction endonuclease [Campylobacter hyointestinalis]|uniref:restriction endonuclease n=1 Tax=Campylobacter hyointestinalis TaxID=198 RepID=UPI000DCC2585|nr:restriction endonuclease [Campylobacter hyointestinalis]RAZ51640.1 restriction endonuclease [Campylobacter hyointestinalis subsp. lawsonii]
MLLDDIVKYLVNSDFALSSYTRDGRLNSAFNEDEIIQIIENKFNIDRPNSRDWFDFSFTQNNSLYPVNIKVSKTNTADNLNCKLGIYYVLTGQIPCFHNGVRWEEYFKFLSENIRENSIDYYFLIINKNNLKDVFYTSLKSIKVLQPNGNNLPFQARWDLNKERVWRTYKESKDFILDVFRESLQMRSEAYESFKRYFYV